MDSAQVNANQSVSTPPSTPPESVGKGRKKSRLFFSLLFILVVLGVLGYVFSKGLISRNQEAEKKSEVVVKNILPKDRLLIFTRCIGGDRQPSECNLYVSGLVSPEEKKIYTFKYAKDTNNDTSGSNILKLIGGTRKYVVYTNEYEVRNGKNSVTTFNELGRINLETGENITIYKHVQYPLKNGKEDVRKSDSFSGVFVDSKTDKVYYSTQSGPGMNGKIFEYDLLTSKNKLITDKKEDAADGVVAGVYNSKLYIAYYSDYIGAGFHISKVLDLKTGKVTNTIVPWDRGVINSRAGKVAYLESVKLSEGVNSKKKITLRVSNLDGTSPLDIYVIPSTSIAGDGFDGSFPFSYIENFAFNEYGDQLSFTVHLPERQADGRYNSTDRHTYLSKFELRKIKPHTGGIILMSPNQTIGESYKDYEEIVPYNLNFKWVEYNVHSDTANFEDGVLYSTRDIYTNSGDWYIASSPVGDYDEELKIKAQSKSVVRDATNVIVVP